MAEIVNDCEAEEAIQRDKRGMNKIAKDVLKSTTRKIDQRLDDEIIRKRYAELYELEYNEVMPPYYEVPQKQDIMNWVMDRPEVRTLDMELLVQRHYLETQGYPAISKSIRPINSRPIDETIKRFKTNNDRKASRRRKNQAQEAQEPQPQQQSEEELLQ